MLVAVNSLTATKFNRTRLNLPKTHWIDATCVGITKTLKILTTKILTVKSTGHGCRRMCRINKFGFPCTEPKQIFDHVSTGDYVNVTLHKDRKNITSGIYVSRVRTPTKNGCEILVNGFRVGFSTMKDITRVHCRDGYSYA